jgi:hypothetical protein
MATYKVTDENGKLAAYGFISQAEAQTFAAKTPGLTVQEDV